MKDRGVGFGDSQSARIDDDGEIGRVTKIGAKFLDVAATVRNDAQLEAALNERCEQARVRVRGFANGLDETADEMLLEFRIFQTKMFCLPLHVQLDHLLEI